MSNSRRLTIGQNIDSGESGGGAINTSNYMTILALEDGLTASLSTNACQYCVDGDGNWIDLPAGTTTQAINQGQALSFKGNLTPNSSSGIGRFTINKKCNLEGNCMSMLFGDDAANNNSLSGKNYAFRYLFSGCTTIIQVSESFLPATTLAEECYYGMFQGCSSLTTAPELPATTLASSCYQYMFYGTQAIPDYSQVDFSNKNTVRSGGLKGMFAGTIITDEDLQKILPVNPDTNRYWLPATTLVDNCYAYMFYGCSSLTTAPDLPATTLARYCYSNMFRGCSSLTQAPIIAAIDASSNFCCAHMFASCTSLTVAPELLATKVGGYSYQNMFHHCSNLIKAPSILPAQLNNDSYSCYENMFNSCIKLTTAPELPSLIARGYELMFQNCSSLKYIRMLAIDWGEAETSGWLSNGASSGTFVKHPSMISPPSGTSGIPSGWRVQDVVVENYPSNTSANLCDVAYWDGSSINTTSIDNWSTSLGTPIGVVVIPSGILPDGMARIVSLQGTNSGGTASNHSTMIWCRGNTDTSLTNYYKVPIINSKQTVSGNNYSAYLPSDNFSAVQSILDPKAYYDSTSSTKIPSPYSNGVLNPGYCMENFSNPLSDFDGLNNTKTLVGLGTGYTAANAAYNYTDSISDCEWYLPAAGEMGFLIARFKAINNIISQLGGVAVPSDYLWSSSENNITYAYYLNTSNGYVNYDNKDSNYYYVRPFGLLS